MIGGVAQRANDTAHTFEAHCGTSFKLVRGRRPQGRARGESAIQSIECQIMAPLRQQSIARGHELRGAIAPGIAR